MSADNQLRFCEQQTNHVCVGCYEASRSRTVDDPDFQLLFKLLLDRLNSKNSTITA
jgi:hypothetical protein